MVNTFIGLWRVKMIDTPESVQKILKDLYWSDARLDEIKEPIAALERYVDLLEQRDAEIEALKARVEDAERKMRDMARLYNNTAAEQYEHSRVCAGVWVPVGERVPTRTGWYEVLVGGVPRRGYFRAGRQRNFFMSDSPHVFVIDVTHWRDVKLPGEQR